MRIGQLRSLIAQREAQVQSGPHCPTTSERCPGKIGFEHWPGEPGQGGRSHGRTQSRLYENLCSGQGVIGRKTVELGQKIQPGQSLLSIVPVDDIWVTADFKETQLKYMRPGQSVNIHVDTFGRDYRGTVENLPGAAGTLFSLLPPENASGNFVKVVQRLPVRIRFNPDQDPQHLLRPGMSVEPQVKVR